MDDSLLGSGTGRFPRPDVLISLPATVCCGWTPCSPEPETSPAVSWPWPEELATRGFGSGSKNKGNYKYKIIEKKFTFNKNSD